MYVLCCLFVEEAVGVIWENWNLPRSLIAAIWWSSPIGLSIEIAIDYISEKDLHFIPGMCWIYQCRIDFRPGIRKIYEAGSQLALSNPVTELRAGTLDIKFGKRKLQNKILLFLHNRFKSHVRYNCKIVVVEIIIQAAEYWLSRRAEWLCSCQYVVGSVRQYKSCRTFKSYEILVVIGEFLSSTSLQGHEKQCRVFQNSYFRTKQK